MTFLDDQALSGNPAIQNILVKRRARGEQQAMLATRACQSDASETARAVAVRAGYSPATMTAYVAEMAAGCQGRVLDAAASEPGAVVWLALEEGPGPGPGPGAPASLDRVAAALRRPAAEVAAFAPADRALAVEQAAFAQALAALADWQRARRALYAGGGGEEAFRYVLDDDQILELWACVDLAQLREALPGLRVVDQRAENPLSPGGSTPPSDGASADAAGPGTLAGGQVADGASDVLLQGVQPRRSNSIDSDVSMKDAPPIATSDTELDTSAVEVKSDSRSESPPEESVSMTELLFGVQAGYIPWERATIDGFADEQAPDAPPDLPTAKPLQELFFAGSVVIESPPDDKHA